MPGAWDNVYGTGEKMKVYNIRTHQAWSWNVVSVWFTLSLWALMDTSIMGRDYVTVEVMAIIIQ